MENYLDRLKDMINAKNIKQFAVFPDLKTFKIIKKDKKEIIKMLKENPEKYVDRNIAIVKLLPRPSGFKRKSDIFAIDIEIYKIYDDGTIDISTGDSWGLLLRYMSDDLEKYPFKMTSLEKIIKLVYKRKITSQIGGLYFKEFQDILRNL
jgi:hypothetical protein